MRAYIARENKESVGHHPATFQCRGDIVYSLIECAHHGHHCPPAAAIAAGRRTLLRFHNMTVRATARPRSWSVEIDKSLRHLVWVMDQLRGEVQKHAAVRHCLSQLRLSVDGFNRCSGVEQHRVFPCQIRWGRPFYLWIALPKVNDATLAVSCRRALFIHVWRQWHVAGVGVWPVGVDIVQIVIFLAAEISQPVIKATRLRRLRGRALTQTVPPESSLCQMRENNAWDRENLLPLSKPICRVVRSA